ncbi:MAG TPA: hypothetical protein VJ746_11775 [Nitrospira sp.]|nr:hypothetical protein [Nitrospira sp.]
MRRECTAILLLAISCVAASCSTQHASHDKPDTITAEGQVAPAEARSQAESTSEDVQERGVTALQPSPTGRVMVPGVLTIPTSLPGEFALRTQNGFYVTAIDGGGRTADPILVSASTTVGPWEKFKFIVTYPSTPYDKSIQTAKGNYVTVMNGGGLTTSVFHTDATQAKDWERFRFLDLGVGNFSPSYYALYTIKGFYVTAVGAGGKYADAFHTDARQIQAWEQFRVVKCGDPGSGYDYGVMAADGEFLAITHWQGQLGFGLYNTPAEADMRYKFIRQGDGTYALQTANGRNYVTAVGGGGQVATYNSKYYTPDCGGLFGGPCIGGSAPIFHTDATQVQAWEKFRLIDQGNCSYAIQTSSGFFAGIFKDSSGVTLLTTRRDGAPTVNEKFQLVVFGLASPVVLQ